ncbi:MAG: response regulator [Rhodothermales bacterium]
MSLVLIIEDDQNLREGLELLFQIEGYDTSGASNGRTGLELVHREEPDVVITDYEMPNADGLEVVRAIRADEDVGRTPVVFLTADHSPAIRKQAMQVGVDAFITKPFRTEQLLGKVADFAARNNGGGSH